LKATSLIEKLAWTIDGRAIVFATSADDSSANSRIMQIAVDGSKPEFTGLAVKELASFSLTPDDAHRH
jgi:Tol biopolymer transport system component